MTDSLSFGAWAKQRRAALNLPPASVAAQVGCALVTLRKIEADARRPSLEIAERLARCLLLPHEDQRTFVQVARGNLSADHLPPPTYVATEAASTAAAAPPQVAAQLFGRADDLAAISALLADPTVRMVTLTGPPGIGKTRLALALAAALTAQFPDGIWFVDLTLISAAELVMAHTAQVLGLGALPPALVVSKLAELLDGRRCLLILDNAEHVLAAAPQLALLLQQTSQLKLLVTSRELLRLSAEHVYLVSTLALPAVAARPSLAQLAQSPAVALFAARAQARQRTFALSSANIAAVVAICAQLDGLPLAIELAATRIVLFAPDVLLAHLAPCLPLLTRGASDRPARQQTLRHALDWSYGLLTDGEQRLFACLGVFHGPFTLAAVVDVAASIGLTQLDSLETLTGLVEKSLVAVDTACSPPRYRLLEPIREYASELLVADDTAPLVWEYCCRHYLAQAQQAAVQLQGPEQQRWMQALAADHPNIIAVLVWLEQRGEIERSAEFAGALWWFWLASGRTIEGRPWLERAFACKERLPRSLEVEIICGLGFLCLSQGDVANTGTLFTQALALAQAEQNLWLCCMAWIGLGRTAGICGDQEGEAAAFNSALRLARRAGYPLGIAWSLSQLTRIAVERGDFSTAQQLGPEAVAIFRALGNQIGLVSILVVLGHVLLASDIAQAQALFEQSFDIYTELGHGSGMCWALRGLGAVAEQRGDLARARQLYEASLVRAYAIQEYQTISAVTQKLAELRALDS